MLVYRCWQFAKISRKNWACFVITDQSERKSKESSMLDREFHKQLGNKFDFFIMNFRYYVAFPINKEMLERDIKFFSINTSLRRALGAMLKINNGEGCSLQELATYAHIDRSHITKAVIELERLGYARRYNKKNDKRVYAELLPEGRRFAENADEMWDVAQMDYFGKCLTDEELLEMDASITKVLELLQKLDPEKCCIDDNCEKQD